MEESLNLEQATFAAGCFWGIEAEFRRVEGVVKTCVGYTGGDVAEPTYDRVLLGHHGSCRGGEGDL